MTKKTPSREIPFRSISGWPVLGALPAAALICLWIALPDGPGSPVEALLLAVLLLSIPITLPGFFIVNPNMSRVLVLFGRYRGTVREVGLHWTNPFTIKRSVSLRAQNLASHTIKVNDLLGNPIEIAAVVVWRVQDTAQSSFDVEDFRKYVDVQVEAAVRNLAQRHPYDDALTETHVPTLRGDTGSVAEELQTELSERFQRAGIEVVEARISHLAYAPEIASAMLQRQQAAAVIAARKLIVEGAVGMVQHALEDLGDKHIVELDDERRATLVGNLLVVLCSHVAPTPILNTGSLYT